ncbi:MAG TPA: aminoglycoside phosphotransferase family protein [Solirubrobacteraceae bacterium]|nr:aminoglycoside phosphotransferase family protein [Solirubrobacteraceae bacterium]
MASEIRIPRRLSEPAEAHPERGRWLEALPARVEELLAEWELELGAPFDHAGTAAWVAPAVAAGGEELVLKLGWRHFEAEHEAEGLRTWAGDGTVRLLGARRFDDAVALLIERCVPGTSLKLALGEPEQDLVIAALLRRLWAHAPEAGNPFRSLGTLCAYWGTAWAEDLEGTPVAGDRGLEREALSLLRELPASADREVLLCTDLHAENVLSAEREPWLVIDTKPFLGDPAFDAVQHMLNCERRLAADPGALADRMANLLDLDGERVRRWLFVRCAQEGRREPRLLEAARRLAP